MNDHQMRLISRTGQRLYLVESERKSFYEAAKTQTRLARTFCHALYYTGARISEITALTYQDIDLSAQQLVINTLKKRTDDHFREIPLPAHFVDELDMAFDIRKSQKIKSNKADRLWPFTRQRGFQIVKEVMKEAGIDTSLPCSSPKGLRHSFGVHAILKGIPITELKILMGHADLKTTAIYTQVLGEEKRNLVSKMWK